jgi:Fic family protein
MDREKKFSTHFDPVEVLPLAGQVRGLCKALNALPVQPSLIRGLEQELVEQSIHASAAMAGNPMRLDEVRECLSEQGAQPEDPAGPTVARARREIANLGLAYAPLPKERTKTGVFGVSDGFLRKVHAVMVQGTVPGGMGEFVPDAENPVLALVTRINGQDMSGLEQAVRAGIFHFHLYRLQPFATGTGRVARFFESSILAVGGYRFACLMQPLYYRRHMDEYLRYFPSPDQQPPLKDSLTEFLVFMLQGLRENLEQIREQLHSPLRRLALAERFRVLAEDRRINRRTHDLLLLLLDRETDQETGAPLPFLLKDLFLKQPYKLLYNDVSEHTARRDLNRLLELGLLTKDGTSYFFQHRCLG